jgi:hypothetical protein
MKTTLEKSRLQLLQLVSMKKAIRNSMKLQNNQLQIQDSEKESWDLRLLSISQLLRITLMMAIQILMYQLS